VPPWGFDRNAATRELQLASLPDIQGSIQANDNKSAAALVVHGLLFAGVLSVAANLHEVFDAAMLGAKIAGGALLAGAACAFAISVVKLINAARPHDPKSTRDPIVDRYKGAFFPPADPKRKPPGGHTGLDDQLKRLAGLRTEADFEIEYAAEQLKLADIRATQAHDAKMGFRWLKVELVCVGLFLLLVTLVSVGTTHLAEAHDEDVRLRLVVTQGGEPIAADAGGVIRVAGREPVDVVAEGRHGDLTRVELVTSGAAQCVPRRGARRAAPLLAQDVDEAREDRERDEGSDDALRVAQTIAPPRCGGRRVRLWASVRATSEGGSSTTTRQLVLRAP
jgi:hypothetical protein